MTSKLSLKLWNRLRVLNGIALRCVEALPADSLDQHPIPNMRTPKELTVHLYGMIVEAMGVGIVKGEITAYDEAAACASIRTRDELVKWCRERWANADRAMQTITDEQASGPVKTPWGFDAPGYGMLIGLNEEFLHHRGQLYAYLRALGAEPPVNWDFENSEPEFRPRQEVQPA
jgi:uncharacterized damage-inducible protein DinB